MSKPNEIVTFWLDEVGPKGWYGGGETLDQTIRDRFMADWEQGRDGGLAHWLTSASDALAYLILMDQFPRNMFREDKRAFSTDAAALDAAKCAVHKGWDTQIDEPGRQFFYLPMMHSESLSDQDRCVRLMLTRMPEFGAQNLLHAKVHREVIRQFGRFPYRNSALSRETTPSELTFTDGGGYGAILQRLSA